MPSNDLIGNRYKTPVWTIGALDSRLLTDASNPFVCASRRITALAGSLALEPNGKDIRSPAKQGSEQLDLGLRRRVLGHQLVVLIRSPNLLKRSKLRNGDVNRHNPTVSTKPQGVYSAVASECVEKQISTGGE